MSVWQKLFLSPNSTRACNSCGSTLGIEESGTVWFAIGWFPFSLSGLFPVPFKLILGSLGIGLMALPYIYLIPLVKKDVPLRQAMPTGLIAWLLVVTAGMFSTSWINWIPNLETKLLAFLASVLLSATIIRAVWLRTPKAEEKPFAFIAGAILVIAMHYTALSTLPPTLATLLIGNKASVEAHIVKKRHTNKLLHCGHKADVMIIGDEETHRICLPQNSWADLNKGDQVLLNMRQTDYGRLITEVQHSPHD